MHSLDVYERVSRPLNIPVNLGRTPKQDIPIPINFPLFFSKFQHLFNLDLSRRLKSKLTVHVSDFSRCWNFSIDMETEALSNFLCIRAARGHEG